MITPTDIANILYRDCLAFGVNVVPFGRIEEGMVDKERIVIHVKQQQKEAIWKKCFVEVNFCVPDINDEANTIRLNEVERMMLNALDDVTNIYDKTSYWYGIESIKTEADTALKCHYVNARLLFEVLNC